VPRSIVIRKPTHTKKAGHLTYDHLASSPPKRMNKIVKLQETLRAETEKRKQAEAELSMLRTNS